MNTQLTEIEEMRIELKHIAYKAIVTDKFNDNKKIIVEIYQRTKKDAIRDLRGNGYAVNVMKVKKAPVFDYIMNNTNCESWDWKENN